MTNFPDLLERLLARNDLGGEEAQELMATALQGGLGPERLAGLLVALQAKGPAAAEIAGFARAMRKAAHRIDAGSPRVLDNCGTGGAPFKTLNVSTAAAFVLAGAGIAVAKHGNRSVTRPSGSADVLERLGYPLDLEPEQAERVLRETGIAFCFAPAFHPAMKHAAPVREALGVKTVFNLLGPLTNPAGATHQVVGVHSPDLVPLMADVLAKLDCQGGFVLHGEPGFDEATPCGPVRYVEVRDGRTSDVQRLDPQALGIPRAAPEELAPVPGDEAAQRFRLLLRGEETGPVADTVALNVAFGLWAADEAAGMDEAWPQARKLLESGIGNAKLEATLAAARSPE